MNIRRTRITKNLINAAAFNRINTVSDQLLIIGKGGKGWGGGEGLGRGGRVGEGGLGVDQTVFIIKGNFRKSN